MVWHLAKIAQGHKILSFLIHSFARRDQAINLYAKPVMFNAYLLTFLGSVLSAANISHAEVVYIKDFSIDRTEVTVAAFAEYAKLEDIVTQAEKQGGGYEWAAGWKRRSGWTYKSPQGKLAAFDEPAVHVTWDEASAYCAYTGGRLPTRDEWILSAFTELREEPHGEYQKGKVYRYPVGDTPMGMNNNRSHHLSVKTTKKGVNGLFDMGGNVWEWLADRREDEALTAGGSWWYGPEKSTANGLQWKPTGFYAVYIGFRCVY